MLGQSILFNIGLTLFVIIRIANSWENPAWKRDQAADENAEIDYVGKIMSKVTDQELASLKNVLKQCLATHGPGYVASLLQLYQSRYKAAHGGGKTRRLLELLSKRDRQSDITEILNILKPALGKESDKILLSFLDVDRAILSGSQKDAEDAIKAGISLFSECNKAAKRAMELVDRRHLSFDNDEDDEY